MAGWSTNKNISPGGQVYDRTTGTWVGQNQGSVGDGSNWGAPNGAATRVIHDANGPVGYQVAQRGDLVTDQGNLIVNRPAQTTGPGVLGARQGTPGTGVGVAGAGTGDPRGVTGPGAGTVVARPRSGSSLSFADLQSVFAPRPHGAANNAAWDTDDYARPADGYQSQDGPMSAPGPKEIPGIPFPYWGIPFELNPHVPSAQVIEDNVGEGDIGTPAFFLQWANVGAHAVWNIDRLNSWVDRKVIPAAGQGFADYYRNQVKPPNAQEPVDWGR